MIKGEWAKIGTDIRDGDTLTILDAGTMNPSKFSDKDDTVFKIETHNGEKNMTFNRSSVNNLIAAYGDESESWKDKRVKAWVVKMSVGGSLKNVAFLAHPDWEMQEDGSFKNPNASADAEFNQLVADAEDEHLADQIPF